MNNIELRWIMKRHPLIKDISFPVLQYRVITIFNFGTNEGWTDVPVVEEIVR